MAHAYVDALTSSYLSDFSQVIIMGDEADDARHIRSVPNRFYCSKDSDFGAPIHDGRTQWASRGRCTQMRFLYIFLTIREEFPDADYYMLLDSDVYMDTRNLAQVITPHPIDEPWIMGHPGDNENLVWGPVLIFSRKAVEQLPPRTLMRCASHWEFACSLNDCCRGSPECFLKTRDKFNACHTLLTKHCGSQNTSAGYKSCAFRLSKSNGGCQLTNTRPEWPEPMYFHLGNWDSNHGDDHLLSFCVLTYLKGQVINQDKFYHDPPVYSCERMCNKSLLAVHHIRPRNIMDFSSCTCR